MNAADASLDLLLRREAPEVLGALLRRFRNFADAEDAVQEALVAATAQWPRDGIPDNPRAWLIRVASNKMTDALRREEARKRRESEAAVETVSEKLPLIEAEDDTLLLLFLCCHPALTPSSAIALTLRAVGGLTTAEIANAFFVPEATMAQRISRAKQTVKSSGMRFEMPERSQWNDRLRSVLHVLYLIFNEGYASSTGPELTRVELSGEAIRLARLVRERLPTEPEAAGLLALMLLTDARRSARTGSAGELIPLSEQDRRLWNRALIEEGVALLSETLPKGGVGPYQLQAAIAAVHDEAETWEQTDWPQIVALYSLLVRIGDNPMVRLNYAVARAMVDGPSTGLNMLEQIEKDDRLTEHHRLYAVRAHLLEMAGDRRAALEYYERAAGGTTSLPERDYLLTRAARLREPA
ncbi:MAG TPA: sigma-70 family RNA polymerase sigma factor [Bryobacteraceae bacterium]|jgi:RNA polymerase sigma factor (sigma-70 family)|nr:sigma-70 family RNA polymerase sigma factor [Bryobacteraceae bacterium]